MGAKENLAVHTAWAAAAGPFPMSLPSWPN